jgi:hypothetical protein
MNIVQQSGTLMEARSDRANRDVLFLSLVGTITPIIGIIVLIIRQDIVALVIGTLFLLGSTFLFTGGVPEVILLDKTKNKLTFIRRKPIGRTVREFRLDEIVGIETVQNGNYHFMSVLLASGNNIQSSRSTDRDKIDFLATTIQLFITT